jgi:flagellar hook-associated protein 1 FlgK
MSDLLSIGASGVRAYQTALTTVSENIANVGTAGYTRRTASLRETGATGIAATLNGMGVLVEGISRASNPYVEQSVRSASSDLSRTSASTVWLDRIESAMGGSGLSKQVTAFFAAGTALAAEPTSTALRASMLSTAGSAADAFATTARALDSAALELDTRGQQAADDLSKLNQALLKVNQGIGRTTPGTSSAAQLSDQRDQLLEQMSALTDIDVQMDAAGRASVRAGGSTGALLVDAAVASDVYYSRSGGNVGLAVVRNNAATMVSPIGGSLAGMVEGAERIDATRSQLGAIADELVDSVNTLQTGGDDLKGVAGKPMFTKTADKAVFSVALTDGTAIAAASRGGGPRDSSNLTKLAGLRTSVGFEGKVQALVTDNAATLKQRNLVVDAQTAIRDGAITARSEMSGVNIDAEAVDLVRFQQAYQASSRVIQVARDTFQSILEIR